MRHGRWCIDGPIITTFRRSFVCVRSSVRQRREAVGKDGAYAGCEAGKTDPWVRSEISPRLNVYRAMARKPQRVNKVYKARKAREVKLVRKAKLARPVPKAIKVIRVKRRSALLVRGVNVTR
jgi:hypothetical protein